MQDSREGVRRDDRGQLLVSGPVASWGEGYMMIGDAFAFIDPVFSSGVMLAMTAGELGAECRQHVAG